MSNSSIHPDPQPPLADWAVLAGRILLAMLFLGGAAQKWADPVPAMDLLTGAALPGSLIWPALIFNALAGVVLVLGWRVRATALLLAVYCGVTSLFHLIPEDPWQMTIFVKNWAISGGCLALYAHGGGRFAVDAARS